MNRAVVATLLATVMAAVLAAAQGDTGPAQSKDAVPVAPTNLWAAQTGPGGLTLVWKRTPGAAGYVIYSLDDAGTAREIARPVANTSQWVVPFSFAGGRYAIATVGANGRLSPKVTFNPVTPDMGATSGTPPPPASVRVEQTGEHQVTVTWDAAPGATAYLISRSVPRSR